MNLDAILDASSGETTAQARRTATPAAPSTPVTITHETAATTFLALAEHYDARRDAAVENAAKVLSAYGKEMQTRGQGMTSAVATPLLAEARRFLDAADQLNTSAARNRALYLDAK